MVGLAVTAGVEPVADGLAGGWRDRGGAAQVRPGGLGAEPARVIPRGDEQQRRGVRADSVEGQQAGGAGGHERDDELVQALQLAVQELRAPSQLAQRNPGGVAGDVAGTGPQRRQPGHQRSRGVLGEAGSQVIGAGQDQGPGLVDRLGAFTCGAALGDHQRADRLDGTVAALRRAGRPAWLATRLADPAPSPLPAGPSRALGVAYPGRYAQAALDRECQRVAEAPRGRRNDTLNRAAFALGQLTGLLPAGLIRAELAAAACRAGLDRDPGCGPRGIDRTIRSGLSAGACHPRHRAA
jgi:hypothetical protein